MSIGFGTYSTEYRDRAATWLILPVISVVLFVLLGVAEAQADSAWQAITLIDDQGFSIRLKFKKVASLADERWLLLELENRSSHETIVDNLHYRVEYEAKPVGKGDGWSSGLCQGSELEVFPRAWDTTPVGKRVLEMGRTHEVVEALSHSAAATLQNRPHFLRCPRNAVLDVSASAHFSLIVSFGANSSKKSIETPLHGIPFTFQWEPPDESAIPQLQQRLRSLCEKKDIISDGRAYPSTRLACALFDIPEVAAGLSDTELKSAAMLTGAFNRDVARAAQRRLFERDPTDRRYLDEMIRAVRVNPNAVNQLANSEFWHSDLTEGIVAATRDPQSRAIALRLLEAHRADWENNPRFVQQLAAIESELTLAREPWWQRFRGPIIGAIALVVFASAILMAIRLWTLCWSSHRLPPDRSPD